jgi:hypothetical protein
MELKGRRCKRQAIKRDGTPANLQKYELHAAGLHQSLAVGRLDGDLPRKIAQEATRLVSADGAYLCAARIRDNHHLARLYKTSEQGPVWGKGCDVPLPDECLRRDELEQPADRQRCTP